MYDGCCAADRSPCHSVTPRQVHCRFRAVEPYFARSPIPYRYPRWMTKVNTAVCHKRRDVRWCRRLPWRRGGSSHHDNLLYRTRLLSSSARHPRRLRWRATSSQRACRGQFRKQQHGRVGIPTLRHDHVQALRRSAEGTIGQSFALQVRHRLRHDRNTHASRDRSHHRLDLDLLRHLWGEACVHDRPRGFGRGSLDFGLGTIARNQIAAVLVQLDPMAPPSRGSRNPGTGKVLCAAVDSATDRPSGERNRGCRPLTKPGNSGSMDLRSQPASRRNP